MKGIGFMGEEQMKSEMANARAEKNNELEDCVVISRQSNPALKIKELVETGKYIVVLDTNILLKIYRSSPDYAEFVLECL